MLTSQDTNSAVNTDHTRLLRVYMAYRLGLGVLLTLLFVSGLGKDILGNTDPDVFIITSYFYVGICTLSLFLHLTGYLHVKPQHILPVLTSDFFALVLMIYSSNEAIGGLAYLLLIPMAVGSTFLKGKTSVALAAFASLLVISVSAFESFQQGWQSHSTFTAGITGILLFITAISFRLLSKKIQRSEDKIQQQIEHSDYLQRIGQHIIETIKTGIVILDNQLHTLFINQAAERLLSNEQGFSTLADIQTLQTVLNQWKHEGVLPETLIINLGVNHDIKISFTTVDDPKLTSLMLLIEDEQRINQEAQQLKLASLGRLTSSIAHEIRNPLGAISHASQLLDESERMQANEHELLGMIQGNCQRINQTISNILQFSKRKQSNPEIVNVCQWLAKFVSQYTSHTSSNIVLNTYKTNIYCRIDPNHLQQIMTNLVDNGLRHSQKEATNNIITLETLIDPTHKYPVVHIIDEGEGIAKENVNTVFEPFYTTKSTGSGLGLYLCKELCQANQAKLVYMPKTTTQKSCFKLILCQSSVKK